MTQDDRQRCLTCGRPVPPTYRTDELCENCYAAAMQYAERYQPRRARIESFVECQE